MKQRRAYSGCAPGVERPRAAATTTTLRVGTGVALLALRDPVIAAKTIATLDWQSQGRVELGVGYGWDREECVTHGVSLDILRAAFERNDRDPQSACVTPTHPRVTPRCWRSTGMSASIALSCGFRQPMRELSMTR